ncbi:hypothetical protein [Rhizobium sp. WSM1325]|uniref:hypothetical protein n=1 Tax=Rhizobium sp. WSM1325 TaxID=3444086 RepID=UPI0019D491B9|nr:hypothetical protein [Rhizobium leguminosarum]
MPIREVRTNFWTPIDINEAQLAAATRFRSLYEAMGGAGTGSFDYSREPVDGGGSREPLTEQQIRAG